MVRAARASPDSVSFTTQRLGLGLGVEGESPRRHTCTPGQGRAARHSQPHISDIVHASLVTQSDSRSRATLARPPRRENEVARDVSVRAVQPAQGERHAW